MVSEVYRNEEKVLGEDVHSTGPFFHVVEPSAAQDGEKIGLEGMDGWVPLTLLLCSFHNQVEIKVDDLVVHPFLIGESEYILPANLDVELLA